MSSTASPRAVTSKFTMRRGSCSAAPQRRTSSRLPKSPDSSAPKVAKHSPSSRPSAAKMRASSSTTATPLALSIAPAAEGTVSWWPPARISHRAPSPGARDHIGGRGTSGADGDRDRGAFRNRALEPVCLGVRHEHHRYRVADLDEEAEGRPPGIVHDDESGSVSGDRGDVVLSVRGGGRGSLPDGDGSPEVRRLRETAPRGPVPRPTARRWRRR